MRRHIDIDRHGWSRNALDQPDIRGPAGLSDQAGLGAHHGSQSGFHPALRGIAVLEHGRHEQFVLMPKQRTRLCAHQFPLAEQA